jgi:hypothetical protein
MHLTWDWNSTVALATARACVFFLTFVVGQWIVGRIRTDE